MMVWSLFVSTLTETSSYGNGPLSNPFIGFGDFFVDTFGGDVKMGELYASFYFQFSYAATGKRVRARPV